MKYRLDEDHYIQDMHLPAGTVIGDGTTVPYRYTADVQSKNDKGEPVVVKAGSAMPPSRAMSPLDDEAKKLFEKHFGDGSATNRPNPDATAAIPVQGTQGPKPINQPAPKVAPPAQQHAAAVAPHKPVPENVPATPKKD